MKNNIFILIISFLCQFSCAQEKVEERKILNTYDDGQTMREHVKYQNNDTLIEYVYHKNGNLNYKTQYLNNRKNGWSYTYNENEQLLFKETYLNNNRNGMTQSYFPNGKIRQVSRYKYNKRVDTTLTYDEQGLIERKTIYLKPCDEYKNNCDKLVIIFIDGNKVYSFYVENGFDSDEHIVHNRKLYSEIVSVESSLSLSEKGQRIFEKNCGMCHRMDKPLVGPALSCITNSKNELQLERIIGGENGHLESKLNENEITALIEYLEKNCP